MKIYLATIGTLLSFITIILAFSRAELGSIATALAASSSFLTCALLKEKKTIGRHETVLLFEIAKIEGHEISISDLNKRIKKHAFEWDLSSEEFQRILFLAQQSEIISISNGIIKINK